MTYFQTPQKLSQYAIHWGWGPLRTFRLPRTPSSGAKHIFRIIFVAKKITKRGDDPEFLRVPEQCLLIPISPSPSDVFFFKGWSKKLPRSALKPLDASTSSSGRPMVVAISTLYNVDRFALSPISYGLRPVCYMPTETKGNIWPSLLQQLITMDGPIVSSSLWLIASGYTVT